MIGNITESDLKVLLDAGKRSSVICGYDFEDFIKFSYNFVKRVVPLNLDKGDVIGIVKHGLKEKKQKYKEPTEKELMAFLLWCYDELKKISLIEEELSSAPDPLVISADPSDFEAFGDLNTIYALCEKYGWTEEYVWNKRYEDVYNLLLHSKISNEFQKRLSKLAMKKQEQ